ncbi:hypothetical protein HPB47_016770, partial [Ixodes persulcatus]
MRDTETQERCNSQRFEEYPEYMQPSAKKPRSGTAVRKREAAVLRPSLAAPSTSKQHTSKSLLHGGNDSLEMCANIPSGDSHYEVEPSAAEVPTKDEGTQVDVRSAVSVVERQKWRRRERDLKSQVDRLKQTVDKYKEELKNLKEDWHLSAFGKVIEPGNEKHLGASFLLDQKPVCAFCCTFPDNKFRAEESRVYHNPDAGNFSERAAGKVKYADLSEATVQDVAKRWLWSLVNRDGFTLTVNPGHYSSPIRVPHHLAALPALFGCLLL